MKTRKTLNHALLVSELYNQLKFPVKVGKEILRVTILHILVSIAMKVELRFENLIRLSTLPDDKHIPVTGSNAWKELTLSI